MTQNDARTRDLSQQVDQDVRACTGVVSVRRVAFETVVHA